MQLLQITWARWKSLALLIGTFQSRLLLTIFYFLLLLPFGIVETYLRDPLDIKHLKKSTWQKKTPKQPTTIEKFQNQF